MGLYQVVIYSGGFIFRGVYVRVVYIQVGLYQVVVYSGGFIFG